MPFVYQLSEVTTLDGNERLYVTDDPTGTPADAYVTVANLAAKAIQFVPSAGSASAGTVVLATIAETTTGTNAAKAVTPDGLAGSVFGTESIVVEVVSASTALTTGDGKRYFRTPLTLNGMDLISVGASVFAKSTSGLPNVMISRGRQAAAGTAHAYVDMLSTAITIDANEFDTKDATTAAVINTSNDDIATGDMIRIDVDGAGTGVTGLWITMGFRLP